MQELTIKSKRNTDIPAIIIKGKKNGPLVMMIHGFLANASEDGRFIIVANELAKKGINTIMFSQAGCGDSKEDFVNYSLDHSLDDIETCYQYMKDYYDIDENRVAMIGYSMGGRLVSLFINKHPEINNIALWAPGIDPSLGESFLGNNVEKMLEEGKENNYCEFYNEFDGRYLNMSLDLLRNLKEYDPLEGLNNYKGNALVIHGDVDETVDLKIGILAYDSLINARDKKLVIVEGADHGFGAWNNRTDLSEQLTSSTIEYFSERI